VPAQPLALRPGYAVSSRDLVGVSAYSPLLASGTLPEVEAGGRLPPGCDAVLPLDGVSRIGAVAEIVATVGPGENVRRTGEDGAAGELLCAAGTVLQPLHIAAAAAAGLSRVSVRRASLAFASVEDEGAERLLLEGVAGCRTRTALLEHGARRDWDGLLDSTGADIAVLVMNMRSADGPPTWAAGRTVATGLALRPGEATQVYLHHGKPLIVVPRRLDALFAVLRCLVDPFVAQLTARSPPPVWRTAPLTRKLASTVGLTEVALLRETTGGLEPLGLGALSLPMLAQAEGWFAVPPESEGLQAGQPVATFRV